MSVTTQQWILHTETPGVSTPITTEREMENGIAPTKGIPFVHKMIINYSQGFQLPAVKYKT